MAFTYEISPSGNHLQIVGTGKITTIDCIGLVERVMSDPRCRPDSTALIDLRDVTYEHKDKAEVIQISTALKVFHSMLRNNIAIIANRATLFPAEILSTHVREATNVRIRVFVDIEAAEAFLQGRSWSRRPIGFKAAGHLHLTTAQSSDCPLSFCSNRRAGGRGHYLFTEESIEGRV